MSFSYNYLINKRQLLDDLYIVYNSVVEFMHDNQYTTAQIRQSADKQMEIALQVSATSEPQTIQTNNQNNGLGYPDAVTIMPDDAKGFYNEGQLVYLVTLIIDFQNNIDTYANEEGLTVVIMNGFLDELRTHHVATTNFVTDASDIVVPKATNNIEKQNYQLYQQPLNAHKKITIDGWYK
jgi:hypothetical protein